jgi:hypothetical protein
MSAAEAVLAAVRAGRDAPVANLGVLKRGGVFEPSAALQALLDGRGLDVPAPADRAEAAWQARVLDGLLRGTVAALGELGLLWIRDVLRVERDAALGADVVVNAGQRVRLHASPQVLAAAMGAEAPPLPDAARLAAALAAAEEGGEPSLEALGFHRAADVGANHAAAPFAEDDTGAWSECIVEKLDDPHVMWDVPLVEHDCRLHRVRRSHWMAAARIAAALEPLAPCSLPGAALETIAERLSGLGRPVGEVVPLLWRTPTWRPARPTAEYRDHAVAVAARGNLLRFAWSGGTVDVPPRRIFDVYALDDNWVRVWGAFDDSVVKDVGPLPDTTVAALLARLRFGLGLPPVCEPRTDLRDLVGRSVRLWVDLTCAWQEGAIDSIEVILPSNLPRPQVGQSVRLRGYFDGTAARLRVLVWRPAESR